MKEERGGHVAFLERCIVDSRLKFEIKYTYNEPGGLHCILQ
jgi:hypothetical protein